MRIAIIVVLLAPILRYIVRCTRAVIFSISFNIHCKTEIEHADKTIETADNCLVLLKGMKHLYYFDSGIVGLPHSGIGCSSLDLPIHGLAPLGWCWFYLTTPCLPFHLPLNQPIFFRRRIKKTKNLFFIFIFALTRSFCRSRVKNGFDSVSLCLDFCSWDAWTHTFMHSTVSEWASPWTEWASEVKIVKRSAA